MATGDVLKVNYPHMWNNIGLILNVINKLKEHQTKLHDANKALVDNTASNEQFVDKCTTFTTGINDNYTKLVNSFEEIHKVIDKATKDLIDSDKNIASTLPEPNLPKGPMAT